MWPRGRTGSARCAVAAAAVLLQVLSACTSPPVAPETPTIAGTFEEAALVAHGEMFRIYGREGEPMPVEVSGDIVTHDGRQVWRLDGTYEVTGPDGRQPARWRLWIGATDDAALTVLKTEGPTVP